MIKIRSRAGLKKSTFPPVTNRWNIPKKAQFSENYKQSSLWVETCPVYIGAFSAQCFSDFTHIEKSFGVTQKQPESYVFIFTKVCSYLEIKWYRVLKLRARMPCLLHSLPSTIFKEVKVTINFVGNFFWRWSPLF